MKNFLILLVVLMQYGFAQEQRMDVVREQSKAIPGCQRLLADEAMLQQYVRAHPETMMLRKAATWSFRVGDKRDWWATDLGTSVEDMDPYEYRVPSTCKAVTPKGYIFVEDRAWQSGYVDQTTVDSVAVLWDFVYTITVSNFGEPPDIDRDSRIIVLILDIQDAYTAGTFVAGYFFSLNELPEGAITKRHSNEAEIIYVDCNPLQLRDASGLMAARMVLSHEFQHMIHWNYDPLELTFINESCSEVSSIISGYPAANPTYYAQNPNRSLFGWAGDLADYDRAMLFGLYLYEQMPSGFFRSLVANRSPGLLGIESVMNARGVQRTFSQIICDWFMANRVNTPSFDTRFGYQALKQSSRPAETKYLNPKVDDFETLSAWAPGYISFLGNSDLCISFVPGHYTTMVRAVTLDTQGRPREIVDVPVNTQFYESGLDLTHDRLAFVIANLSSDGCVRCDYSANGKFNGFEAELRYDESEPIGYLKLATGDTVCVLFEPPAAGAKLDSIRVALRRSGQMNGMIREYSGTVSPSPSGRLLASIAATSTQKPEYPYAVPYPNWMTVNLSGRGITISRPFIVSFAIDDSATSPFVMVTTCPTSGSYYSFTYLCDSWAEIPGWYYITSSNGETYLWLIRAYISYTATGVESVELTPREFVLFQNYPNPFNPSTTIRYSLPRRTWVRLEIFDLLGRKIKTLLDGLENAGERTIIWSGETDFGERVGSGMYIYRLIGDGAVISRRILILR